MINNSLDGPAVPMSSQLTSFESPKSWGPTSFSHVQSVYQKSLWLPFDSSPYFASFWRGKSLQLRWKYTNSTQILQSGQLLVVEEKRNSRIFWTRDPTAFRNKHYFIHCQPITSHEKRLAFSLNLQSCDWVMGRYKYMKHPTQYLNGHRIGRLPTSVFIFWLYIIIARFNCRAFSSKINFLTPRRKIPIISPTVYKPWGV